MSTYTADFEEFWRRFPKRWNRESDMWVKRKKTPAFKSWQKLSAEIHKECLAKVHLIRKSEGSASSVRDCVTWLNQEGWEEIDLKPKEIGLPAEMTKNVLKTVEKLPVIFNDDPEERESIRKDVKVRNIIYERNLR